MSIFSCGGIGKYLFHRKANSTVLKEVTRAIKRDGPISREGLDRSRFKKHWAAESSQAKKSCLLAFKKFIEFQVSFGQPHNEWDFHRS